MKVFHSQCDQISNNLKGLFIQLPRSVLSSEYHCPSSNMSFQIPFLHQQKKCRYSSPPSISHLHQFYILEVFVGLRKCSFRTFLGLQPLYLHAVLSCCSPIFVLLTLLLINDPSHQLLNFHWKKVLYSSIFPLLSSSHNDLIDFF